MVPEAAAGIGRVGYLIANSAAVDAVGGALITVLLGWAVQLFADRKRIAWRAYLDTRINLTPAQAARLRFRVYVDEPGAQPPSEVELPWLALLRVRNAGFVPIRGTDFHAPLTFVFPGRVVRGAEVIDHSGAAGPDGAYGTRGVAQWLRGWVTGTLGHTATTPDGRAPTDQVQLGEGLLLNRRDRFTLMVVLSGTPSDARRRIRQAGSLIGGRVVAEPPRRGPNTRSMLFGGSVALPLAGLLLGLTTPQIRGIFTGAYKDWKQLGGVPGPIRIVSRYPNSGSQRAFDNFVLGGAEPQPSSYDCTDKNLIPASPVVLCQQSSTQALLQMVASIPGAVGYAEASDAAAYTGQGAQPVDLNGLPDTFGNVGTGPRQYPFWTVEYLYTYGTPARSSLASKFIDYVQSSSTFLRANDLTPCSGLMHTLCALGAR